VIVARDQARHIGRLAGRNSGTPRIAAKAAGTVAANRIDVSIDDLTPLAVSGVPSEKCTSRRSVRTHRRP
jgi:hypothetical protein